MKTKIVFLSCDKLDHFVIDDGLLAEALTQSGDYEVTTLSWSSDSDWSQFDVAILRTTWDYMERPDEFLKTLESIQSQGVKLLNPLEVVKWNFNKIYLLELESKGVRIVPTVFFKDKAVIPEDWKENRFVVKPTVSAGAWNTFVVSRAEINLRTFSTEDWMLQPYLEEIHDGELSLHYFNKNFSHAIIKKPKAGDFRVQEEHGGIITPYQPSQDLLDFAHLVLENIPCPLLYARVDVIPLKSGYALMELELIEPSLYFRTNADSTKNFCAALHSFL